MFKIFDTSIKKIFELEESIFDSYNIWFPWNIKHSIKLK